MKRNRPGFAPGRFVIEQKAPDQVRGGAVRKKA